MSTQSKLREKFSSVIIKQLKEELQLKNIMSVPRMTKVSVNIGLGQGKTDARFNEVAAKTLEKITGQKAILTKAKKSIAGFKIREGMNVGAVVTLRGDKMFDFIDKLVNITLPKVRDFSGLDTKSFDRQGNYSIGFKEHLIFPEIKADEVEKIMGLQVTVTTTATNKDHGIALLKALGFPFKK